MGAAGRTPSRAFRHRDDRRAVRGAAHPFRAPPFPGRAARWPGVATRASRPASTRASNSPHALSATLFKVRAASLLSARTPDWCAGFLSGLLIGAEIGAQRDWIGEGEVAIVGTPGLPRCITRAFG